jgi:hypothetical protein
MCPNAAQLDKAVDRSQQMRLGQVTFQREFIEQGVELAARPSLTSLQSP